jgi:Pyruvate/2-oxoacid:ferredoxin oxidoreductase delta subunit
MKRKIINIDQEKCTGCGNCIPNCPEGAIQIIDGKARLVSDLFCDGLGACIGHCPEDAITVEEREASPYDEEMVMENIVAHGENTIRAHLSHLKEHGETEYLRQALCFLEEKGIDVRMDREPAEIHPPGGCPGARAMSFAQADEGAVSEEGNRPSQLTHWPIQLHLVSPLAPQFQGKDLLLAADCVAYTAGDFHRDFLKGKALSIACPKLDSGKEVYIEKLRAFIDHAKINTLTVMTMQVPCCSVLVYLAEEALRSAERHVPLKHVTVSLKGEVLEEEWITEKTEAK